MAENNYPLLSALPFPAAVVNAEGNVCASNDLFNVHLPLNESSSTDLLARMDDIEIVSAEGLRISRSQFLADHIFNPTVKDHRIGLFNNKTTQSWLYFTWSLNWLTPDQQEGLFILQPVDKLLSVEKQYEDLLDRFHIATRSANLGIWDWNIKDDSLYWDAQMFKLYGLDPETCEGTYEDWRNSLHPDDLEAAEAGIQKSLEKDAPFDKPFRIIKPDGTEITIQPAAEVKRDEQGNPIRMIGLNVDVSTLHNAQQQLVESEKLAALGQLAAGVAHEINNPIGFVTSNTNLAKRLVERLLTSLNTLKEECESEETGAALLLYSRWEALSKLDSTRQDLTELVDESLEGLERVKDIVKDLKEYAHVGSTKYEATDINRVLKSAANLLRNEIKYVAEVHFDLAELPPVECLSSQVNQVFINIIVNACHAMKDFGKIALSSSMLGEQVEIRISDNGVGMPKDVVSKIFDPFFTTKPIGKGTGIGLAISKTIIDSHSGSIKVDSTPGHGTTFTIRLPIAQPEGQAEPEVQAAS